MTAQSESANNRPLKAASSSFTITPLTNVCCSECGQPVERQLPTQTQLNARRFVTKRHPRIRLRGKVDSLHSIIMLVEHRAHKLGVSWLCGELNRLAYYCREIVAAEYNERPMIPIVIDGLTSQELHSASHNPQSMGTDHLLLDHDSHEVLHWLNIVRSNSREAELAAYDAFTDEIDYGASVASALNIISAAAYYLALKFSAEIRHSDTPDK